TPSAGGRREGILQFPCHDVESLFIPPTAPFAVRLPPPPCTPRGRGRAAVLHPGAAGPSLLGYSPADVRADRDRWSRTGRRAGRRHSAPPRVHRSADAGGRGGRAALPAT